MAFQRRSPRAVWYWRASFQAASTASEPPETKKQRCRSPGARSASSCASSIERGWAKVQLMAKGSSRIWAAAASPISSPNPYPMFTQ